MSRIPLVFDVYVAEALQSHAGLNSTANVGPPFITNFPRDFSRRLNPPPRASFNYSPFSSCSG